LRKINGNGKTIIMATHDYALLMKFHWNVKTLKYLKWFKEQFNAFYPYSIYNYNAYPLVKELHSQCLEATIDFEILLPGWFSSKYLQENQEINTLENCLFKKRN
jgi:hypothetical protein